MSVRSNSEKRLHFANIFWLGLAHLMVLFAAFHFNRNALWLCLAGVFLLAPLGVNLGFHRLLTHRSLQTSQWLEYILVTLGAAVGGGPPLHWVAEHRLHHRYSDTAKDPHDAQRGFWYAHIGHLFFHKDFEDHEEQWMKYIPDLAQDRYYLLLNRYWVVLAVATLIPLYIFGGLPFVLWAGFVRVVIMLHLTWLVNSASHLWGYKNYKSKNASTNCWWVGLLAAGEGWHNNHHAFPSSAAHGHKWWELDLTYLMISILAKSGLAKNVQLPSRIQRAPVQVK